MSRVVVLGATSAGFAVAARLARAGHDVELDPAGVGPNPAPEERTVVVPAIYRDTFTKTGRRLDTVATLVPVEPARRYCFPDGTCIDLPTADRKATLDVLGAGLGSAPAQEWDAFLADGGDLWSRLRHEVAAGAVRPPTSLRRWRTAGLRRRAASRLSDPRLRLLVDSYALAAGVAPTTAAESLIVLPYLEHAFGTWRVDGGRQLVDLLAERATTRGVRPAGEPGAHGPPIAEPEVVVDARHVAHPAVLRVVVEINIEPVVNLPAEVVLPRSGGLSIVRIVRPEPDLEPSRGWLEIAAATGRRRPGDAAPAGRSVNPTVIASALDAVEEHATAVGAVRLAGDPVAHPPETSHRGQDRAVRAGSAALVQAIHPQRARGQICRLVAASPLSGPFGAAFSVLAAAAVGADLATWDRTERTARTPSRAP